MSIVLSCKKCYDMALSNESIVYTCLQTFITAFADIYFMTTAKKCCAAGTMISGKVCNKPNVYLETVVDFDDTD